VRALFVTPAATTLWTWYVTL